MSADWKLILDVVELALDLDPIARAAFVEEACGGDAVMRLEVEAMLAARGGVGDRPAGPAAVDTEILPAGAVPAKAAAIGRVAVGTVVDGKYRVDGVLGSGGMGAVYRATHLQLERPVALKSVRADLLESPTTAARFRREAVAVARLRHPNIVTVHDYGVAPEAGAYLVMELLEGHSLRDELASRMGLDAATALAIAGQACAAVGAAHRAGIVHRDLKPDNVFLERREGGLAVKVVDFGLAKLEAAIRETGSDLTHEGAVLGTPAYMSPEQCRGEEADARSDVYSLGCVVYEMLTGRAPFAGTTAWSLVYQHVNAPPKPPRELVPDLAPAIEAAVLRALAKAPDDRFETAEAFAEALGVPVTGQSSSFPPVPVEEAAAAVVTGGPSDNLPHPVTRFVGREREIEAVRAQLARARLVTLVGPGGIGKTRLALETAARAASDLEHGVRLVELASFADPTLVAHAVRSALGLREQHGRSDLESLEAWLREKRLLLVLDNCEHLVGACAWLTEKLLGSCSGLRVLATSREPLAVAGEAIWPVPPLATPAAVRDAAGEDRDAVLASEAVRLLVDRASLAKPSLSPDELDASAVAELCRRLEGIPLAIELAAARLRALTVEQILERLDDRFRLLTLGSRTAPARQQALQATLDWSYELLTEEERVLFRRLSVFAGGWTLEAAEYVCGDADTTDPALLDVFTRLVDKSLVGVLERHGAPRYGMLEMIRGYAAELLTGTGEAREVRRRHAEFFEAQAEASKRAIWAGQSAEWLERLEEEHDNVRATFAWLLENDPDASLRLAAAINPFRELHGHLAEARRDLESALERSATSPASTRVNALLAAGSVASIQGDVAGALTFYEQCVPLAKEAGTAEQVAYALYSLGALANVKGDLQASRAHLEESLAISRQEGHATLIALSINSLGEVARLEGDAAGARDLYEQAVALCRVERHDHILIVALCNLGAVACDEGDVDMARACYEEALRTARALGSEEFVSLALDGLAAVAAKRGDWERAARLAGAAEALLEAIGAVLAPVDRDFRERYLADVRAHLGEEALEAAMAEGRAGARDRAIDDAHSA